MSKGVFIKGWKLPKTCGNCVFNSYYSLSKPGWCARLEEKTDPRKILSDCPLKEIPGSMDLIDRSALLENWRPEDHTGRVDWERVRDAPKVI